MKCLARFALIPVFLMITGVVFQCSEAGEMEAGTRSYNSDLIQVFTGERVKSAVQQITKGLPLKVENWKEKDSVLCVAAEIAVGSGNPKYRGRLAYANETEFFDMDTLGGYPTFMASASGGLVFNFDAGRYNHTSFGDPAKGCASIVISTGIEASLSNETSDSKDDKRATQTTRVDIDLTRYIDWPTLPEMVICIGTEKRQQIIAVGKHEGRKRWSWLLVDKSLRFPIYQAGAHEEGIGDEPSSELLLKIAVHDKGSVGPIPGLSLDILKAMGIESEPLPKELRGKRLCPYDGDVIIDPRKFESVKKACNQAPMLRLMNFCGVEQVAEPVAVPSSIAPGLGKRQEKEQNR